MRPRVGVYQQAKNLSPEKSPQSASILVAYGRFLFLTGKFKDSIEKDRRAIESHPESRDAHYELAKGLGHEGDFKDAALEGERALTLPAFGTSDAEIHLLLANLYLKLKQPDLAKAHLEKFQAAPQTTRRVSVPALIGLMIAGPHSTRNGSSSWYRLPRPRRKFFSRYSRAPDSKVWPFSAEWSDCLFCQV